MSQFRNGLSIISFVQQFHELLEIIFLNLLTARLIYSILPLSSSATGHILETPFGVFSS